MSQDEGEEILNFGSVAKNKKTVSKANVSGTLCQYYVTYYLAPILHKLAM